MVQSSEKVAYLIIVIGSGVLLKLICNIFKPLQHLYYPFVLLSGFLSGLIIYNIPSSDVFKMRSLAEVNANTYLLIFFPVMLFDMAFSTDYQGIGNTAWQFLVISMLGYPIQAALLTFVFHVALGLHHNWSWDVAIIFSIIMCIIEPDMVVNELNKTQTRVKHVQLFLQGELLITMAVATYSYAVAFEYYFGSYEDYLFILEKFAYHFAGLLFGLAVGYLMDKVFIHVPNDYMPVALTLTMVAAFFSFYIGHIHIRQAGVIATLTTGVILSPTKIKTTSYIEANITYFWTWLNFLFNTVAFAVPGLMIGLKPDFVNFKDFVYVLIVYIMTCFSRCLLFVAARPLLNRIGHFFTWADISILVVGPVRAAPTLIVAMLYRQYSPSLGQQVLTYAAILSFFSTIFNSFSLPALLNLLGMYDLTHARAINMRNAINHVRDCRNKAILSLKMDRIVADANWPVVYQATQLAHHEIVVRQRVHHGVGEARLPDLLTGGGGAAAAGGRGGVALPPPEDASSISSQATRDQRDLEIEARQRILNVQLVSLWKQYDMGLLAKKSMRFLALLLQTAADRDLPKVEVEELQLSWVPPKLTKKLKVLLQWILMRMPKRYESIQLSRWRRGMVVLFNHVAYQIISTIIVLIDTYFILNYALYDYWPQNIYISRPNLQIIDYTFYSLFLLEFILLLVGVGFQQYFTRRFNQMDFTCNIVIRSADVIKAAQPLSSTLERSELILQLTRLTLLLRLNRLYTFIESLLNRLLHVIENRMDSVLFQRYDIGKGFLVANDQALKYLRQIVQDKRILVKLRREIEEDRKKISKSLGIIQRERPNVAVTIKTRHAIKQVINEMNDSITDIYDEGLLDDIEKKYLIQSILGAKKVMRSLKIVSPCSPEYILKDVPWLFGEQTTAAFLLEHARLQSYSYHDIIIDVGDDPSGIFILVSGMVKCAYRPSQNTVDTLFSQGALPNCDFLVSLKLEEYQEDYIVSGNVIGELGTVTGRRFDMSVICESEVQVYYIPRHCMFKILFEMENCVRIYSKVWRCIGIKIALLILQYEPNFQGWLREKLLLYLEKSFVPIFSGCEELYLNDLVADVILVEGVIMDGNTRNIFKAPCRVPRTTNKLILPGTTKWDISTVYETRLLIIPSKHAEETDIMGPGGILQETFTEGVHHAAEDTWGPLLRKSAVSRNKVYSKGSAD